MHTGVTARTDTIAEEGRAGEQEEEREEKRTLQDQVSSRGQRDPIPTLPFPVRIRENVKNVASEQFKEQTTITTESDADKEQKQYKKDNVL